MKDNPASPSKRTLPDFIPPMLATLTDKAFDSDEWFFEIKYDGYRTLARIEGNHVDLLSRNNQSFNQLFHDIRKAFMFLGFNCLLDGEIAIIDNNGLPDFNALQNYQYTRKGHLVYFVFDVLYYQNTSLIELPLSHRKKILEALPLPYGEQIQLCKHIRSNGNGLFTAAKNMGLEGIIAKKANSLYTSGRTKDWLKIKNTNHCEAIIIGYTRSDKKKYFGALLLGYYQGKKLVHIGHAGTGFNQETEKDLYQLFQSITIEKPEVEALPGRYSQEVVWVKPEYVCRIQFAEITPDKKIRHCSFKGLIEKKSSEITDIC